MGVFLTVLKIIGFVLLGIIGLIVLIIALILLWPFKYRIEASYYPKKDEEAGGSSGGSGGESDGDSGGGTSGNTEKEDGENGFDLPKAKAQLSFFFKAIRVILTFEDMKLLLRAKVLWITVYENLLFGGDEEEEEDRDLALDLPGDGESDDLPEELRPSESGSDGDGNESVGGESSVGEDEFPEIKDLSDEEIKEFMEQPAPKVRFPKSVDEFFDNIENFIQQIKEKWYNAIRKCRDIKRKVRYYTKLIKHYWRLLHHPSVKPAFQMLKKIVIRVLKHVKPRKARIYIHYGADNPADTGKAVAIYSMIYPYFPKQIKLDADFNNKVLEGNGYIKGRFHVIVFALCAIRAYLNKHIRKLIALLLREVKRYG